MRIFRTLLLSQLLAAVILAIVVAYVLVNYAQQQLDSQRDNARNVVVQILNHHVSGDGKILSRQLERSFNFTSLRISQLDGTILHEQSQSEDNPALAVAVLKIFGAEFKNQTVRDKEQDIQIVYQLDLSKPLQ